MAAAEAMKPAKDADDNWNKPAAGQKEVSSDVAAGGVADLT